MRKGAWMLPWNISADWLWLYNDNSGVTHFCALVNNTIVEFTDSVSCQDNGVAFPTSMTTGLLKASEDGQDWMYVHRVIFVLDQPQGQINVSVNGKTEDAPIAAVGGEAFVADNGIAGWSEAGWSELAWSEVANIPATYGVERTEVPVDIDAELNWLSCTLSTSTPNASYELTDIIVEYLPTGTKE
jgi:hypothetical protein